jgi:uncharacterized protein YqjF (DUF2071 family)
VIGTPPGSRAAPGTRLAAAMAEIPARSFLTAEWRRGVVFLKELVPRRLVALVARCAYHENYVAVPMRHDIAFRSDGAPARVEYSWIHAGAEGRLHLVAGTPRRSLETGTVEAFLAEHYFGYVRQPDGETLEYAVEHPAWRIWPADEPGFETDVPSLYGSRFTPALDRPPDVAFLAEGSEVRVLRGTRFTA